MKRLAVLTSGGDAPGMNAAIRASVRKALYCGARIYGINRGYYGLIHEEIAEMDSAQVGDIVHRGGTILHSARSEEFKTEAGLQIAVSQLKKYEIDGLIVIGGDGSFRGAISLMHRGVNVIGIPASIDNDIGGTDNAIGFDTAVNTVLDAVNKLRDTASSHAKISVLEVMGRNAGCIALTAGLAGGADAVFIPERPVDLEAVAQQIKERYQRGKNHSIIIVAEGCLDNAASGESSAYQVARSITIKTGYETRLTVLGHIQRGGTPSAHDRVVATMSGAKAVELLLAGESGKMVGFQGQDLRIVNLEQSHALGYPIDFEMANLINIMSVT